MILADIWDFFQNKVFPSSRPLNQSLPVFNPYSGIDPDFDLPGADELRGANLRAYLESFDLRPTSLLVGEAPGWRGCRFSGVPFTSEAQLVNGELPFHGRRTSQRGSPYTEATATIFWGDMAVHHPHFLAWNCIPYHPHRTGSPLSNRPPTRVEIELSQPLLEQLVALLQPGQVIAVGRSAERSLTRIGITPLTVRHPARGGAATFRQGIEKIFREREA